MSHGDEIAYFIIGLYTFMTFFFALPILVWLYWIDGKGRKGKNMKALKHKRD